MARCSSSEPNRRRAPHRMRQCRWQLPETGLDAILHPEPKHELAPTYHWTPSLGQELTPSEVQVHTTSRQSSGFARAYSGWAQDYASTRANPAVSGHHKAWEPRQAHADWCRGAGTLLVRAGCQRAGSPLVLSSSTSVHSCSMPEWPS